MEHKASLPAKISITHPIRIDEFKTPGFGLIGMTFCPGKKQASAASGAWDRDLETDLDAIARWGAEVLISLIEPKEYTELCVELLPDLASRIMVHYQLPMPDGGIPDQTWQREWTEIGPQVRSVLRRGSRICIHCKGGLGRTGLVAAQLLVELGLSPMDAIAETRKARNGTIENVQQEDYVRNHNSVLPKIDRFRGCLLAGAVGDALGAPVEFLSLAEIHAKFGQNGIRDYAPAYGRIGAITDDTQMTLFTAEGVLRAHVRGNIRGLSSYEAVTTKAYLRWLATQDGQPLHSTCEPVGFLFENKELHHRRAPGNTCLSALQALKSAAAFKPASNNSKGCGGVMRMAPVGLYAAAHGSYVDDAHCFDLACALASITHGHPTGQHAAGAFALIIKKLAEGSALDEAIDAAITELAKDPSSAETLGAIEFARRLAAGPDPIEVCIPRLGEGWVAEEALAIAVFCSLRASTIEEGICAAVNITGDSDSTGSITGNILGALYGASSIPTRWLKDLELKEVIAAIAEDHFACGDWIFMDYLAQFKTPSDVLHERFQNYIFEKYPGC